MKLNFIVNKYILIWNLLYATSINSEIHKLKQKLWEKNKKEYSMFHKEKEIILKDINNYIPSDDVLYNAFETSEYYKKIKQETNRYRLSLMSLWDIKKRQYTKELNKILKYDFSCDFTVCVINPNLNIVETSFANNLIIIGKKIDYKDEDSFLAYLLYKILQNDFENIKIAERNIITVILELVALNELYTRMTKESKYNIGKKEYITLKNKIYPYWLMYLGVLPEDMEKYMVRDNIFFNIKDYKYDNKLKIIDIFSFMKYIINNKEKIMNKKEIGVEKIEVETL